MVVYHTDRKPLIAYPALSIMTAPSYCRAGSCKSPYYYYYYLMCTRQQNNKTWYNKNTKTPLQMRNRSKIVPENILKTAGSNLFSWTNSWYLRLLTDLWLFSWEAADPTEDSNSAEASLEPHVSMTFSEVSSMSLDGLLTSQTESRL